MSRKARIYVFRVMSRKDERDSCCKEGKRSVWVMGENKGEGARLYIIAWIRTPISIHAFVLQIPWSARRLRLA
jgi:hypothetical protein